MTNWLEKWLPECKDIVIVAGSDGVKYTSVEAKDLTAKAKAEFVEHFQRLSPC